MELMSKWKGFYNKKSRWSKHVKKRSEFILKSRHINKRSLNRVKDDSYDWIWSVFIFTVCLFVLLMKSFCFCR